MHRVFGVPVGYCGPWKNKEDARFVKFRTRMEQSRLFVMDEMSMIGRQMLGKIAFRTECFLGNKRGPDGQEVYMGAKSCVMAGDPK